MYVASSFKARILSLYPETGRHWLNHLPHYIEDLSEKWGLSDLKPLNDPSYHYVLQGLQNNEKIILKLGLSSSAFNQEKEALKFFIRSVSLLRSNPSYNALLLEKLDPGTPLTRLCFTKEKEACLLFAETVQDLQNQQSKPPLFFTPIKKFLSDLKEKDGFPYNNLTLEAKSLFSFLVTSTEKESLLHGDLHGDNILKHGKKWIAIDPKGYKGDLLYELAVFVRNPYQKLAQHPEAQQIMEARIQSLSSFFKSDPIRLKKWVFVQCVLASAWAHQDSLEKEAACWIQLAQKIKF